MRLIQESELVHLSQGVYFTIRRSKFVCTDTSWCNMDDYELSEVRPGLRPFVYAEEVGTYQRYEITIQTRVSLD